MCPLCTQAVPEDVVGDEAYRTRCHYEVVRLQRLLESEDNSRSSLNSIDDRSLEELKARIADLERQKRKSRLEFRVSEKGGVSVYGLRRFPVTLYYERWVRLLDQTQELKDFLESSKGKLKLKRSQ